MNKHCIVLVLFLLFHSFDLFGQSIIVTKDGLRSSEDAAQSFVEYKSFGMKQAELFNACDKKVSYEVDFFSYDTESQKAKSMISVEGPMNGSSLLVLGSTEIRFKLEFYFEDNKVRVVPTLTRTNGTPIDLRFIYSSKGNVRWPKTKTKIETELNNIVKKVVGEYVDIN